MSLHDYLDYFHSAIARIEDYGFIEKISYAYQYHDKDGKLIFRYDNARHKPNLGFIDHKHRNDGTIVECAMPNISDVVDEVISSI